MGTQYAYRADVDLVAFVRDLPAIGACSTLGDRSAVWLLQDQG